MGLYPGEGELISGGPLIGALGDKFCIRTRVGLYPGEPLFGILRYLEFYIIAY